jgi:ATP-dependent helicase/nuclease subunit B
MPRGKRAVGAMSRGPRVFSIPPGSPFLPTLVDSLLEGRLVGGDVADATIYLPTRRAARALAALLADRSDGRAQLLPRIVPLGEAEDAAFDLAGVAGETTDFAPWDALRPPIAPLERRLILTRLVQLWSAQIDRDLLRLGPGVPFLVPASPADAVSLAGDLEALMDAFTTEEVGWDKLATAVDADYSRYFEITRDFVRIVAENWPRILHERQASDPAQRRNLLIAAEAKRLLRERPQAPIVAAGSTGSVPATAALLAAIAGLPNGAVVLPGLDTHLDEASWRAIGGAGRGETDPVHGHPQAILHGLLERHLRVGRSDVELLRRPASGFASRERLLSEVLRPADTTHLWSVMPASERLALSEAGTQGLALVEATDEREEALAIALALRETLARPGRTAALVTPDRSLARRVSAELSRWGVVVEDSAGVTLAETTAGRLARLAADAAALDFHPVRVLALLAHPGLRLGWARERVERAASVLEVGVLRGPAPRPGLSGLREALALRRGATSRHTPRPWKRLRDEDWDLADALIERLARAFATFTAEHHGEDRLDLLRLSTLHGEVVERLTDPGEDAGDPADDEAGEALAALFDDLALTQVGDLLGRFADYPAFFTTLAKQRVLQAAPRSTHRRLKILGLLEARLLDVDRVVLGGLDEGTWPPRTEADAFLNRPMRARVGLTPPERRIGQTAHDFVQALGCRDVVITRAQKRDSTPMVPSRLLQRLKAFVGDEVWKELLAGGNRYRALARQLDEPVTAPEPLARPAPKPDPILIPRSLSVTDVETLVRDPYAIFARHVLKLDALAPLALIPSAADRGTIIHDVLGGFAGKAPEGLPPQALEVLLQLGQDAFLPLADAYPELYAEWWPRFERLASEFVVWEQRRRGEIARVHAEVSGSWPIALADGSAFTLRARADRIEVRRDGGFVVVDFKTGAVPSVKEVFAGFAPQLTLEAAMLIHGAFRGLPKAKGTPALLYVHTTGGRQPLNERPIDSPKGDPRSVADLVAEHGERLKGMIARYLSGEVGFASRPFPKYAKRSGAYDHLARVQEWSLANQEGDEP